MPRRLSPLATNEFYHVFNRGTNKQRIFLDTRDYKRGIEIMRFYAYSSTKPKYSRFITLSREEREELLSNLEFKSKMLLEIVSYCLMPNHFHFLFKQAEDNGISTFMRYFQNSYTRYFNIKYEGIGSILQGAFKAVRIEDTEQLLQVARYIDLNPFSAFLVKSISTYEYSSYREAVGLSDKKLLHNKVVLDQFSATNSYKKFVEDHTSYQQSLKAITHLLFD